MNRAYSTNWVKRNAYRLLKGKPEEKRPLGKPRLRLWIILKFIVEREREWGSMDWINLAEDMDQWGALVNTVRNFWFP
jgi:hypothetical protein